MNNCHYDVSIVVPVYNAEKFLEKTINAVIGQTIFSRLEVILVNDGSIDKSYAICEKYEKMFPNINLINQNNSGVSEARNRGLESATGDYITFLDSDDLIDKDLYEKELNLIKENKADIAVVDFDKIHKNGNVVKYRSDLSYKWDDKNEAIKQFFSGTIGNQVVDKLFLRKILREVRFPREYKIGEDMFFVYQALQFSSTVVMDSSICGYHYIVRDGSAMTGNFSNKYFDPVKLSEIMLSEYQSDYEIFQYAKAHLIHETCKALEYTYRHKVAHSYSKDVLKMRNSLKKYKVKDAKSYLIKKQFYGFLLMRFSPNLYLLVHKLMRIG
jgi:glycosyltransferase involved in cell wall biosynthesis